jgi:hypothetical protein
VALLWPAFDASTRDLYFGRHYLEGAKAARFESSSLQVLILALIVVPALDLSFQGPHVKGHRNQSRLSGIASRTTPA